MTAHQFANQGMSNLEGPLILSHDDWVAKYQGATKRKRITYSDYNNKLTARHEYSAIPGVHSVTDIKPNEVALTTPSWYEAALKAESSSPISQAKGANINKSGPPPYTVNNETKTVLGQSLPAVTETLPSSKSPVIEIANEFTERAIPNTKGQRYIYQLGETGGERWEFFEKYVKSSRSRHDIPAENVFGELTANRKSAIFNTPQPDSLSKLTKNDRLDIPVHGSSFGPTDAGSKHLNIPMKSYPAKDVAKKLYDRGLREVGVLRIDSCNLGDGRYLDDLKRELEKLGIKFGYLCAPNGYLQVTHLPGTNIRPVWTWRFTEPWRVVKGNADVNFPGTKYNSESV